MTWSELVEAVIARARGRCEYCRMHQALQGNTFHVEHIVPQSRGGPTTLENLCLSCPTCNLRKSDRVAFADEATGVMVSFFNPRTQVWDEHFHWQGYEIVGITLVGRISVAALGLNEGRRRFIRQIEERLGLFPP